MIHSIFVIHIYVTVTLLRKNVRHPSSRPFETFLRASSSSICLKKKNDESIFYDYSVPGVKTSSSSSSSNGRGGGREKKRSSVKTGAVKNVGRKRWKEERERWTGGERNRRPGCQVFRKVIFDCSSDASTRGGGQGRESTESCIFRRCTACGTPPQRSRHDPK